MKQFFGSTKKKVTGKKSQKKSHKNKRLKENMYNLYIHEVGYNFHVYCKKHHIAGQINPIFHNNCAFYDASMKLGRNTHVGHLLQKSPLAT